MSNCPKCGTILDDSAKFCTVCGTPISAPAQADSNQPQYNQAQQLVNNQASNFGYPPNMGYPPPPQYGAPIAKPVDSPTIGEIFSKAFSVLGNKPILLWGLSLLYMLLCSLAVVFGFLPIISIPIILVLSVGMTAVFLDGYRGKQISSEQLFVGFKNFKHFCGGMAWAALWVFIWGLIPIVGIVFAVMKAYSYRFIPYILLTDAEISPADAMSKSIEQTKGYRGRMFGADILIVGGILVATLFFYALSCIPYMGIIFSIIYLLIFIVIAAFAPLLFGTIQAAFYDEISKKNEKNNGD